MTVNKVRAKRGRLLLSELKALVNSFSHEQRTDVIETLSIVLTGLDTDSETRRSVPLQPRANAALNSRAPADLSKEVHGNKQKRKEGRKG